MLRKLIRKFGQSESQEFPAILSTGLAGINLKFHALVREDYSRIKHFDGERTYFELLIQDLRPDDSFIDVGAFTGQVSSFAAMRCSQSRVLAIEPDPEFCARIRDNLALNRIDNVEVVGAGLADQAGELSLNTSGGKGWAPSFVDKGLDGSITVPVTTLDEVLSKHDIQPDVLKIDVEGFEYRVLLGGREALSSRKLRSVYIEFHPRLVRAAGDDIAETICFLNQFGFCFEYFEPRKQEITAIAHRRSFK